MADPLLLGHWESHIVLTCITCEKVILLSRTDEDRQVARTTLLTVLRLLPVDSAGLNHRENIERINNLFLPTVCSSCSKSSSWKTLSIKRTFIETWQPYLAMCAFLGGDLSLLRGSSISMVHHEDVRDVLDAACVVRSVEVNPAPEAAAQVKPYLQSGSL